MSQDARTRAVIDEAVAQATAPLEKRVSELDARLRAVEESGGPTPATESKRPSAGRTARAKADEGTKSGQ